MVFRLYVEKREGERFEAESLLYDLRTFLGIEGLQSLRVLNRYDAEGIDAELFLKCKSSVFAEPQLDVVYDELPDMGEDFVLAVEYLPGQFDQRADSAAQCIQIISRSERPTVRSARIYALGGALSAEEREKIKRYLINPVESREATLEKAESLKLQWTEPEDTPTIDGFCALDERGIEKLHSDMGLAMDTKDLEHCRRYFSNIEGREPTLTELKVIDTYWSDHCRHTTFLTELSEVSFEDKDAQAAWERYMGVREDLGRKKPVTLMDIGTIAAKFLRKNGMLAKLDESEEVNACTVKIQANIDGKDEPWLLLFKNETHNHPTEIEPFGGAATCIGGAIRDPLSGRSYVYAAMRLTGAGDPRRAVSETLQGKLPQRKLTTTAAAGYSSYGNQIGLATGRVDEWYHEGYVAKRMEVGAVIAAAPEGNVMREEPRDGDVVIMLGGRTGRDGCGGATGSSKSHDEKSLESCGAEVQKGNAPEERKIQRLFRNAEASRLIRRCNDFGAGGVSVAVGELAAGLVIELDRVTKKYEGLSGTELAISESQERMAVVVAKEDSEKFMAFASEENIESTVIATVTQERRLIMRHKGRNIVDLSRDFLDTNGAPKSAAASVGQVHDYEKAVPQSFTEGMNTLVRDLNVCSQRGLTENFDSTIGAGSVLMPLGGEHQLTPTQAMVNLISTPEGKSNTASYMAWGFNPYIGECRPYAAAYYAVLESCTRLVASGASFEDVYLSFQEYFERPGTDKKRWGKPLAALLGAFDAQMELGVAAIGGKDSMSGSFKDMDVPPTLISFAVTTDRADAVISPEFKAAGSRVVLMRPDCEEGALPKGAAIKSVYAEATELMRAGKVLSAWSVGYGGVAEGILKMCLGNKLGFSYNADLSDKDIFGYGYGSLILELAKDAPDCGVALGVTSAESVIEKAVDRLDLNELMSAYESVLEDVFPTSAEQGGDASPVTYSSEAKPVATAVIKTAKPRVLIPVFPGTNCEYDTAKAFKEAGAVPEIFVLRNLTAADIERSVTQFADMARQSEIIFIPGGFSGGDEPDGSGKFITAFFRNAAISEAVTELLDKRGGLMGGICNGFQALIKLGLLPTGKISDTDDTSPTLGHNVIGRHQSRMVRTRVASTMSPWLSEAQVGEIYTVPISHGEGRFICSDVQLADLAAKGQILTQYVDDKDVPTYDIAYNPNGSAHAVEGICSPDGRIFGKMGHSERIGEHLYRNVSGRYDMGLFRSATKFFK